MIVHKDITKDISPNIYHQKYITIKTAKDDKEAVAQMHQMVSDFLSLLFFVRHGWLAAAPGAGSEAWLAGPGA